MTAKNTRPPEDSKLPENAPVSIERDEYNKMMEKMLEDEERLSVLWFDFSFEQLLNGILTTTFPRRGKEIRSMVN